jgi:hypothetical protein
MDCSICFNNVETPVLTPCGHSFCSKCFFRWIQEKRNCPNCRTPFVPETVEIIELRNLSVRWETYIDELRNRSVILEQTNLRLNKKMVEKQSYLNNLKIEIKTERGKIASEKQCIELQKKQMNLERIDWDIMKRKRHIYMKEWREMRSVSRIGQIWSK